MNGRDHSSLSPKSPFLLRHRHGHQSPPVTALNHRPQSCTPCCTSSLSTTLQVRYLFSPSLRILYPLSDRFPPITATLLHRSPSLLRQSHSGLPLLEPIFIKGSNLGFFFVLQNTKSSSIQHQGMCNLNSFEHQRMTIAI